MDRRHGLHAPDLPLPPGSLPRCLEILHHLVIGECFERFRSPALFLARGAVEGSVVLRGNVPFGATIHSGPWIVRQFVAASLLAGLVERLNEFTGEVCALVIGIAGHPSKLAAGPIRSVRLLSDVKAREIFVVDLLLKFA